MQSLPEPGNEDNDGLGNITTVDLKDVSRTHRLSTGRMKKDLVARLSEFMESLAVCNNDAVAESLEECNV